MEHDPRAYLLDIRDNCDLILGFVEGIDLSSYKGERFAKVSRRTTIHYYR